MKLTELEPQLLGVEEPGRLRRHVDELEQAQGVMFLCPACLATSHHMVMVWFRDRGVPDSETPGPGRWAVSGSGLADLTLSPSILIDCWHGFVRAGEILTC